MREKAGVCEWERKQGTEGGLQLVNHQKRKREWVHTREKSHEKEQWLETFHLSSNHCVLYHLAQSCWHWCFQTATC